MLYAGLAAGVLGEKRCPYRRVSVDDVIRYCTHDCVVTVIEGSEPVVSATDFFSCPLHYDSLALLDNVSINQILPRQLYALSLSCTHSSYHSKVHYPSPPKYIAKRVFGSNSNPQNNTEFINRRAVLVNNNGLNMRSVNYFVLNRERKCSVTRHMQMTRAQTGKQMLF